MECPLCHTGGNRIELTVSSRDFYMCSNCRALFTGVDDRPNAYMEKERYLKHENTSDNKGYINFLMNAVNPALPYLSTEMRGLDYGCGPQPVLTEILKKKGFNCACYDPFFAPKLPSGEFDFIFSTETFEHFFHPDKELKKINDLLLPGGLLIAMTQVYDEVNDLSNWHYLRDFTHVFIYSVRTFDVLAELFGFEIIERSGTSVFILRKKR